MIVRSSRVGGPPAGPNGGLVRIRSAFLNCGLRAARAQRIGEIEMVRIDRVQVQVHQQQAEGVGHVLQAAQRLAELERLLLGRQLEIVVGLAPSCS